MELPKISRSELSRPANSVDLEGTSGPSTNQSEATTGTAVSVFPESMPEPAPTDARPRVLLVEDDNTLRVFLADYLDESGYRTDAVGTATEGLESFLEHRPGLVITDRLLPDGNGENLALKIKAHSPSVAILLISTLTNQPRDLRLYSAVLTKPFSLTQFDATVDKLRRSIET